MAVRKYLLASFVVIATCAAEGVGEAAGDVVGELHEATSKAAPSIELARAMEPVT